MSPAPPLSRCRTVWRAKPGWWRGFPFHPASDPMPQLWTALTADPAKVRAADPAEFAGLGAIAPAADTMVEARTRAARAVLLALRPSGVLSSFPGGTPAVLNALANLADLASGDAPSEAYAELVGDLLASAYRHVVYGTRTQMEGDVWAVKMAGEGRAMRETADLIAATLPRDLGTRTADNGAAGPVGSVAVFRP